MTQSAGINLAFCVASLLLGGELVHAAEPASLEERIRTDIARLNAPDFKTREKASDDLADLLPQARGLLEKRLSEPGLSDEQRERLSSLLKEGKSSIWARRSGLSESDLDLLRQLRAKRVERPRSFELSTRIEQMFANQKLADEGIALIIDSLCSQIPPDKENQGFEPWQLGQLFSKALDQPAAGPATAEALGRWIDEWMLPGLRISQDHQNAGGHQQDMQILSRLLVADALSAEKFDQAWRGLVAQIQAPRTASRRVFNQYGLGQWFIVGFANSQHTRPGDLSELMTALLFTAESTGGMSMSYGYDPGMLRYLLASASLTDLQARAIGDWLVSQYDAGRATWNVDDLLQLLTGATVWKPDDRDLLNAQREEFLRDFGQRWREWWKSHRATVVGGAIGPSHRFVSVTLTKKQDGAEVTLKSDTLVQERRGKLIRHPERFAAEWVLVLEGDGVSQWGQSLPPDILRQLLLLEANELGGGRTNWISGSNPIVEGDVDLSGNSGWQSPSRGRSESGPAPIKEPQVSLRMLLPASATVTPDQLKSIVFWEDRLIQTVVRYERWADEASLPGAKKFNLPRVMSRGIELLEPYRTAGLEKRVIDLQKEASPHVASGAGLLLAEWKLKPDRERMVQLLASEDAQVAQRSATALTLSGEMQGIESLIDRASKESSTGGKALLVLSHCADEPRLTPDQRSGGAVRVIERLLPAEETAARSAAIEALLARRWTGQDYGYRVGATPEENTRALQRYHEWARHPMPITQPESEPSGPGSINIDE